MTGNNDRHILLISKFEDHTIEMHKDSIKPGQKVLIVDDLIATGVNAIAAAGKNAEITRFKGLGEISPDEFKHFIGKDIRLDPVTMKKEDLVKDMLEFYMGKNTMERQNFIIDNLVVEEDVIN